ncbi:MAG: hypothetical protein ABIZ49_10155 [Opitutaceae bacterium]
MKTYPQSAPHALTCALALMLSGFSLPAITMAAEAQGDAVQRLVGAAAGAVRTAKGAEETASNANRDLLRKEDEAAKAGPAIAKSNAVLAAAQDAVKDAIARKQAADKGVADAQAEVRKFAGTYFADSANKKLAEAKIVAPAAARKVDEAKAEETQRSAEAKIAAAPLRALALAKERMKKTSDALEAAKGSAQSAIDSAAAAAENIKNQGVQQANIAKQLAELRKTLAGLKSYK